MSLMVGARAVEKRSERKRLKKETSEDTWRMSVVRVSDSFNKPRGSETGTHRLRRRR
jgi:hypothetical protein